jgi:hypothetical protein
MDDVGLCARCEHAKVVRNRRGSTFYLCSAPGLPKYPPLPVRRCDSFRERRALRVVR